MNALIKSIRFELIITASLSLALGAVLSAWLGPGSFLAGWLGTTVLLLVCSWILVIAWRLAGGGKALAWMVALAFVLRLGTGLLITWGLPNLTHTDDYITQAGYYFRDAYARDREAWVVAQSGSFFSSTLKTDFMADQYGGMLVLFALVYRLLSPDAHRLYMVLILTAAAGGLSLPFFWSAVRKKWGPAAAIPAAWVLVLYPEGVLLGGAQMREPFLILMSAVMLWAVIAWPQKRKPALAAFGLSLVVLLLLSPPAALAVTGIFLGWWFIQELGRLKGADWPWWGWLVISAVAVFMVGALGDWLLTSSQYDISQTIAGSDRIQGLIGRFPAFVQNLFMVGYGLTQPVLPAAAVIIVGKETPLLLKMINLMTSLGWYVLMPFLIYSLYMVWRYKNGVEKRLMVWLAGAAFLWILVSSARGGGDQWDNPRYRAILLILLALLTGLAWSWAREHRDAWLGRWLAVEGIFLFFFTGWYLKRYTPVGFKLPFWVMIAVILGLSAGVLVGGWAWDAYRSRQRSLSHP